MRGCVLRHPDDRVQRFRLRGSYEATWHRAPHIDAFFDDSCRRNSRWRLVAVYASGGMTPPRPGLS